MIGPAPMLPEGDPVIDVKIRARTGSVPVNPSHPLLRFAEDEVVDWLAGAGLSGARVDVLEAHGRGRDLPATFIASAQR